MNTVWVRNADTGAEVEVPESAVPVLAASGWSRMSKTDVARIEKGRADERTEIEKALTSVAGVADTTEPAQGTPDEEN